VKLVGVLAVLALALAGHYFLVEPLLRSRHAPPFDSGAYSVSTTMPSLPADPRQLATQPFAMEGVQEVAQPPDWVVVPPAAHLLYGFRREIGGTESWTLHYLAATSPAEAESFYRTRMPELGYKLVKRTGADGSFTLTFLLSPRESYWVSIRLADNKDQAAVALAISRPARKRP
jgi:hypothetical protein